MKKIIILPTSTIRDAMKLLTQTGEKCLLVADKDDMFLGTLTDGDLRPAILTGSDYSSSIEPWYHKTPSVLYEGRYSMEEALEKLRINKIDLIPVLNSSNKVIDYITWSVSALDPNEPSNSLASVLVVIMAGGMGSRLEPFTKVLPKPLIPIHDKTVIEHIIDRFYLNGANEYLISVNYKSRIIKAYFEELSPNYKVEYLDEDTPLGTAGSLGLLRGQLRKPFFVTNCDIIVKADLSEVYNFHVSHKFDITLVASMKNISIPYGICKLNDEGYLSELIEKPNSDYLINTGLYVINPDILNLIPANQVYHITDLIEDVKLNQGRVGVFPVDDESWIDVGQWAEYKKAIEIL
jgi:dTDP-glucose pyrophosphorylase